MKYGKHTDLVEAFLAHLKSGNVDWEAVQEVFGETALLAWDDAVYAAKGAARVAWKAASEFTWQAALTAVWQAALKALEAFRGDTHGSTQDAAWEATWEAAGYAAFEILGHEVLAKQGKPLVFLPMFGIESIEQLKEMVK